jgi:hypothetical protein
MNLKNAFLASGRYEIAGRLYIKERQLRRAMLAPWRVHQYQPSLFSATKWGWPWSYMKATWRWLMEWGADLSCCYGERPLRIVFWALIVILAFSILYAVSGGLSSDNAPMTWLDYLNYSLGAFTTMGFNQYHADTALAQTLTSIEALLGISLLALLMFALGNRISRS